MKKQLYVLLFWMIPLFGAAQVSDKLTISKQDIITEKIKDYDRISWKSDFRTKEVGNPELPVYRVSYVLPVDVLVTGVSFTTQTKQKHEQNFNIIPVQQPVPTDNSVASGFTQPNKAVYQSTSAYPNKLYEIESDRFYMGYHLITLRIYPFEYLPMTQTLNYYTQLEFTINYTAGTNTNEISPQTQNLYRAEHCKTLVQSLVRNPADALQFGSNVQTIRDGKTIIQNRKGTVKSSVQQKTKALSVLDEQVPDYIIITNNALKPTFQTLADWKTKKGIFTIIKTTEEISTNYSGSDLQEKIRNYIIESWSKWGPALYVLLGGGVDIIPARMVVGDKDILNPTDVYYATSNVWTYSNNVYTSRFNNNANVFIGRYPVNNSIEAKTLINKTLNYEKANMSDLSYLRNNLCSDAYILPEGTIAPTTPLSYFKLDSIKSNCNRFTLNTNNKFICDNASCNGSLSRYTETPSQCPAGDIELNHDNFLNCLNYGANLGVGKFHFIYHMDHASSQGIGTSSKDKGNALSKVEMGNLTNGDAYQIFMSGSCHSANFAENCVAQYYLTDSLGGGVAYIGNTDIGDGSEWDQLKYFLSSIYNIGIYKTGLYDIGSAFHNIINKRYPDDWRLHLLGDPEMQVWSAIPTTLTSTLSSKAVSIGAQTVNVTVSGLATGDTARICFWKGTEVYVTQEKVTNGTYPISFTANTPGNIFVTVTAHNFKPYMDSITVNSTNNPNLSVSTVDFGDGIVQGLGVGNANGQNDAGETINLKLGIKNTGVNTANGVTATLTSSSPFITITSSQGSFGNIVSGATAISNLFNYIIRKNAPGKDAKGIARPECLVNDQNPVSFTVTIKDATNTTWTQNYNIDVFKDSLMQCNKTIVSTTDGDLVPEAGEDVTMHIALQNIGKAPFLGYNAVLTSTNTYCTINSGNSNFTSIAPMEIKNENANAIFSFHTTTSTTSLMAFNLKVTNAYGKEWNLPFTLQLADTVSGKDFSASEREIDLTWSALSGIGGYNIYRCDYDTINKIPVGNYIKLNNTPFHFSYYNDLGLNKLTRYCYKIATVSSSGMESFTKPYIVWTSYPQINLFPVQMDGNVSCGDSPFNVADVNYDGKKEIFMGSNGGSNSRIVALNYYGSELNDIDNNVTTYDGFARIGKRGTATPCIADIYRDGKLHIIEPTRGGSSDSIYSFSFEGAKNNDLDWKLGPMGPSYRGAVAANLDNSTDGSMEIITTAENGPINIFNNKGSIIHTLNPGGGTYGAIAVADLDGDGKKEIIKAYDQGIYIWNSDGSDYKGSNPYYQKPTDGYNFTSSVIVCDLNGDGKKVILTSALQSGGTQGMIYAIQANTTNTKLFPGWATNATTIPIDAGLLSQEVTVGDLNNDGKLEVVAMSQNLVKIWSNAGNLINTIPVNSNIPVGKVAPILADVDNNHNDVEIIVGNNSNKIYAYKIDGSPVIGFPLRGSGAYNVTLCVADIDNDGKNEIVGSIGCDQIGVWKTNGIPSKIEWGSDRHDQYNTGEYQTICDPTIITTNATWDSSQSVCGDIILKSGSLTINNNSTVTMGSSSMIIVMSGASLVIDSGNIQNANVRALTGSNVTIKNNGTIKLSSTGQFYSEVNTIVNIPYGGIVK